MKRYSILNNLDNCFYCGRKAENIHEVYFGRNRQASIKNGFCVGLCFKCHRNVHDGASYPIDKTMDLHLKRVYQKEYEKTHTREEFRKIIDMSYI